jgi:hypothetical protein
LSDALTASSPESLADLDEEDIKGLDKLDRVWSDMGDEDLRGSTPGRLRTSGAGQGRTIEGPTRAIRGSGPQLLVLGGSVTVMVGRALAGSGCSVSESS